jgi:hypothetical protein
MMFLTNQSEGSVRGSPAGTYIGTMGSSAKVLEDVVDWVMHTGMKYRRTNMGVVKVRSTALPSKRDRVNLANAASASLCKLTFRSDMTSTQHQRASECVALRRSGAYRPSSGSSTESSHRVEPSSPGTAGDSLVLRLLGGIHLGGRIVEAGFACSPCQ